MFEKVNPAHPDKVADRIAGALVDLAYRKEPDPRIAVEVLLGHGNCHIVAETSVHFSRDEVEAVVTRIGGALSVDYQEVAQDAHLAQNQCGAIRCGDNGIFKGMPVTEEQKTLTAAAKQLYEMYGCDGKYILSGSRMILCQSNATEEDLRSLPILAECPFVPEINPLGEWEGGTDTDSGATNRKLGSDMGDAVTGGGLHGKDLSKADVSVNIYAHLLANDTNLPVELHCSIGDETVNSRPYSEIVEIARGYIEAVGGFEKFAEWGLI